jgi:hypothetical protein
VTTKGVASKAGRVKYRRLNEETLYVIEMQVSAGEMKCPVAGAAFALRDAGHIGQPKHQAMIHRLQADAVLLLHLAFIVFVVVGGLFLRRCPHLSWLHLPAVLWGVTIELSGYICPLTPLENRLT